MSGQKKDIERKQLSQNLFREFWYKYLGAPMSFNNSMLVALNNPKTKEFFNVSSLDEQETRLKLLDSYTENRALIVGLINVINTDLDELEQKVTLICEILYKHNVEGNPYYAIQSSEIVVERIIACDDETLKGLHESPDKDEAQRQLIEILKLDGNILSALADYAISLWCDGCNRGEKRKAWTEKVEQKMMRERMMENYSRECKAVAEQVAQMIKDKLSAGCDGKAQLQLCHIGSRENCNGNIRDINEGLLPDWLSVNLHKDEYRELLLKPIREHINDAAIKIAITRNDYYLESYHSGYADYGTIFTIEACVQE